MSTSNIQTAPIERLSRALPAPALVAGEDVNLRSGSVWGTPGPAVTILLIRPVITGERSNVIEICHDLRACGGATLGGFVARRLRTDFVRALRD